MNKIKKDFSIFTIEEKKVAIYAFLSHNFIIIKFIWVSKESFKKIKLFDEGRAKNMKEKTKKLLLFTGTRVYSSLFFLASNTIIISSFFVCRIFYGLLKKEILWCIWIQTKKKTEKLKMCIAFYQTKTLNAISSLLLRRKFILLRTFAKCK